LAIASIKNSVRFGFYTFLLLVVLALLAGILLSTWAILYESFT